MYSAAVILPVAVGEPKVIDENPSLNLLNSVSVKCKSPVAVVPKPIVVLAVLGAMVSVDVPDRAPLRLIESVFIESAFAPIAIEPLIPTETEAPVIVVAPNTLLAPTTPLIATAALPALIPTVLAELLSKLLTVPLNVMLLFVVEKTVFCLINTALLKDCVPVVVIVGVSMIVVPAVPVRKLVLVMG